MEESRSPPRSRSPILARAIAMELHVLPQGDRLDIQRLHDAVQKASEWRHLAGGLEVVDRLLDRLSSSEVASDEVKNFQTLVTNLKNEAHQLKTVAYMQLFSSLDSVNLKTDQLARHRDGTPFVAPDGQMSSLLAAQAEEIKFPPQFHRIFPRRNFFFLIWPPRGQIQKNKRYLRGVCLSEQNPRSLSLESSGFFLFFLRGLFSCRSSDLGLADLGEDTPLSQREGGTPISSQHLMVFLGGRPSPI